MNAYDSLVESYQLGRVGYASDLYDALVEYGVTPSSRVVDVACGTGLASRPLIENGFNVTGVDLSQPMLDIASATLPKAKFVHGPAEALPLDDESFDLAMSAQAFHQLDHVKALSEMLRVLRPGGIVAIWWKHLTSDDPVRLVRDAVLREVGVEPPGQGLVGGFKEFYAAPLADRTLRVIPWRTAIPLEQYITYNRSRKTLRDALGLKASEYFKLLDARLRERHGGNDPYVSLSYMHYLYLGKR